MVNADSKADVSSETADEIKDSSGFNEDSQSIENTEDQEITVQPEVQEVSDKFTDILTDFTRQLSEVNRISQERELIIDRLHKENQQLKQGEFQQALLPIFRDLIRFYDDLNLTISDYSNNSTLTDENFLRDLGCYKETISDILYRYGVEQIEAKVGEDFNSKEHKAIATAPTDLEEEDRNIAKIIRHGFKTDSKIVRNVEVEVYRYAAPPVEQIEGQIEEPVEEQTASEIETIESTSEDK